MGGSTRAWPTPSSDGPVAVPETEPRELSPWEQLGNAMMNQVAAEANKDDVVLYMTLNSTTHHKDEIPESLAALEQAEKEGLGTRKLMPISDPYNLGKSTEHDTYDHSLGEKNADKISFWHGDKDMKEGEVRIGEGKPIMLGTENVDLTTKEGKEALAGIRDNWDSVLEEMGMDDEYRAKTLEALMGNGKDPKKLGSGDGATNELLQYTMAMYRAEKGEYNVKSIVLSGHHWNAGRDDVYSEDADKSGQGIWGEKGDHEYDAYSDDGARPGGDFFSLQDVGALKDAFPEAYGQVESVQFAACNTHNLGMPDPKDPTKTLSTDEWLQGTFDNIERASYWQGFAPTAAKGAWTNGEFLLDDMRADAGKGGWDSMLGKQIGSNKVHRSELNAEGDLERMDHTKTKVESDSYIKGKGKVARGMNKEYWKQSDDRKDHLYTAGDDPIGYSPEAEAVQDAWDNVWDNIFGW